MLCLIVRPGLFEQLACPRSSPSHGPRLLNPMAAFRLLAWPWRHLFCPSSFPHRLPVGCAGSQQSVACPACGPSLQFLPSPICLCARSQISLFPQRENLQKLLVVLAGAEFRPFCSPGPCREKAPSLEPRSSPRTRASKVVACPGPSHHARVHPAAGAGPLPFTVSSRTAAPTFWMVCLRPRRPPQGCKGGPTSLY